MKLNILRYTELPPGHVLPILTLYTKEPCPLCDDLVAQLEDKFAGQFELKKVFIDKKENVRYLRLFRHDIPVLFFNGQFLCMHRLNEDALTERLAAFKNDMEASQMD
ncbi:glutaredoxin-like protein C5orf63 homolog isoform X2 [Drosophila willistoni]|uniref:glutaredoxin-like protein C5orf63 homolog isoform X2 n=1 Tax=Drosophila willistoni TaxID=7260 RepID=UPI000C26CD96|nr:glutaredoxin-like protein C5orf63 homolog isoform X2 [Drosophila willistoni]